MPSSARRTTKREGSGTRAGLTIRSSIEPRAVTRTGSYAKQPSTSPSSAGATVTSTPRSLRSSANEACWRRSSPRSGLARHPAAAKSPSAGSEGSARRSGAVVDLTCIARHDERVPAEQERVFERLRELCLALPETNERLSHGQPTFFVRDKRPFAMVLDNHHGDGRFAMWCAAQDGLQEMLVEADPERFFRPPYVGHRGWLGVRLDRGVHWNELAGIVEDAYAEVAPPKLVEGARRAVVAPGEQAE